MFAVLLMNVAMTAQDGRAASVAELVPRLVENGRHYAAALPSLSCEETIRSEVMHNGSVDREVVATATMTVKRSGDDDEPFVEVHRWKTRNGKPLPDGSAAARLPFFTHGIFANALGFSSVDVMTCNEFTLSDLGPLPELLLSYQRKSGADELAECRTRTPGLKETLYVDRRSGHVDRLVRTVPDDEALQTKTVAYGLVEYAPVLLGGEAFWLPRRAEVRMAADERRMLVEYSGCHRFASTVTITGGTETVPAPQ